jgi:hypothetical protein
VPAMLDLGPLEALVRARKAEAEDHVWFLREDPGYFSKTVLEAREHRTDLLRCEVCGKLHKNARDDVLWARVHRNVVTDSYIELSVWHEIHRALAELRQMSSQYAQAIKKTQNLPPDFWEALVNTWFYLEATQLDVAHQLKDGFAASPGARAYYLQQCEPTSEDMVLFGYLWEPHKRHIFKVHTLVEVLGNLLQNQPRAKSMMSPWVASRLSQLSIVSECLHQLHFFHPWSQKIQFAVKERQTELLIDYVKGFAKWHSFLHTTFKATKLVQLGKPGLRFHYPVHKRRTRNNVETLRSSEASLDAIWQAADDHFRNKTGETPHAIIADILQERTLQRTPPWEEPEKDLSSLRRPSTVEYVYVPFSNALQAQSRKEPRCVLEICVCSFQEQDWVGLPCCVAEVAQ